MIGLLLLAQAVVEEAASSPSPCKAPRFMTASTTGAFLVVAEGAAIHVVDGKTLRQLKKLDVAATAVGFDAADAELTVVGESWLRFDTRTWTETRRAGLPEAEFRARRSDKVLEAGQALATADGAVYYRSKGAHLSKAIPGNEVKAEVLTRDRQDYFEETDRVLCLAGPAVVVDGGGRAGVAFGGRAYGLAVAEQPIGAALLAGRLALVRKGGEALYDLRTWKVKWTREAENLSAAFDVRRGRVFCAGKAALRYWSAEKPEEVGSFAGSFQALAIDGASTRLFGISEGTLRAWTLKD